jgi:prepilin-type processing-associated H-X9-DG protein
MSSFNKSSWEVFGMSRSSSKGLGEAIAAIFIVVLVFAIFVPVIAASKRKSKIDTCMSNLSQIGRAIRSYMTDWEDTYPSNRVYSGKKLVLSPSIRLSRDTAPPVVFQYGVNWVEALYPYIELVGDPGDNDSVWACPTIGAPARSRYDISTRVTYAINNNLIEQKEGILRNAGATMLVREMDRPVGASCRPVNVSKAGSNRPKSAFLTGTDPAIGQGIRCKAVIHDGGSNILFTDGHVKTFTIPLMPPDSRLVWDNKTKQWWNAPNKPEKQIAVTP